MVKLRTNWWQVLSCTLLLIFKWDWFINFGEIILVSLIKFWNKPNLKGGWEQNTKIIKHSWFLSWKYFPSIKLSLLRNIYIDNFRVIHNSFVLIVLKKTNTSYCSMITRKLIRFSKIMRVHSRNLKVRLNCLKMKLGTCMSFTRHITIRFRTLFRLYKKFWEEL